MLDELCLLVRGPLDVHELSAYLQWMTGCPFIRADDVDWPLYCSRCLRFDARVYESDLVNAYGIEFERYALAVDVMGMSAMARNPHYIDVYQALPRLFGSCLAAERGCESILVDNLAKVLETFVPRGTSPALGQGP